MEKGRLNIRRLIVEVVKISLEDDIFALASQLAYGLLFSLFPFLIFLMTLVGFSNIRSYEVLQLFERIMPEQVFSLVKGIVLEVTEKRNGNLLSFSLIISLWASMSGFNAIIKGLNMSYKEEERRGFLKVQLVSFIFTMGLIITIFAITVLMVFASVNEPIISRWFHHPEITSFLWDFIKYFILVLTMLFVFSAVYRYTPAKNIDGGCNLGSIIYNCRLGNVVFWFFLLYK
ncbi:YihY/virulence factor BrkB family protein [Clostridium sp. DMHC 10]|uniref:YihY/virulence factor BrkB family protein n=1 Tax=Clostridium sp. DMHC 10 TaxID=747377 RepID=UPI000AFB28BD|nr:YihY/virulence factor BrkB family protein [Clostridium sp. DMHC 10]